MHPLDQLFEHSARSLARRTSRRSLLTTLGTLLTGGALLPLLPIDRSARAAESNAAKGNGGGKQRRESACPRRARL